MFKFISPKQILHEKFRLKPKACVTAVLAIVLIFTISCTRNVKESRFITENAKFNFIFVCDSSRFKDDIRSKLIVKYRDRCNIDVVNINKLNSLRPENYDVILIMDTCLARTAFNPSTKSFLNKFNDHENIVLFITAGDSDWKYRYKDIDAITSASKIKNEETVFSEITEKIDKIISDRQFF